MDLRFGVMDESVASVTTSTDDLWDELVLDSGSVSTAMSVCMVFGHQCERRREKCTCKTFSSAESHRMDQEWCLWSFGVRKDVLRVKSSLTWQMLRSQWCHWER